MPIEEKLESAKKQMEQDFKIALIRKNMTQAELADLLNLSRSQVNKAIKGGTNKSDVEVRKKIYKFLGMEWFRNEQIRTF